MPELSNSQLKQLCDDAVDLQAARDQDAQFEPLPDVATAVQIFKASIGTRRYIAALSFLERMGYA